MRFGYNTIILVSITAYFDPTRRSNVRIHNNINLLTFNRSGARLPKVIFSGTFLEIIFGAITPRLNKSGNPENAYPSALLFGEL